MGVVSVPPYSNEVSEGMLHTTSGNSWQKRLNKYNKGQGRGNNKQSKIKGAKKYNKYNKDNNNNKNKKNKKKQKRQSIFYFSAKF
jgi:hypothetical protein